jgi:hypothetical protein
MFIQQPHLALPPETEIRNTTIHQNLSDQTPSTVPHIDSIPTATVHISMNIAFDPIWRSRVRHGKHPPVDEKGLRIDDDDVEGVDRRGTRRSVVPSPCTKSVSVMYTISSLGEKQIPFGRPKPSAMTRTSPLPGSKR